jgi:uncharacterized membrane protein YeaQ/YmgE (transglycosylase-associated protein family)
MVIDRLKKVEWPEIFAALIGGGLWGALVGTVLWSINGDIHSIWVTAVAVAVVGAVVVGAVVT